MSGLVIAAPASGAGKTTVTLALTAAARRRGLAVQPFKVGPDFIDPGHHAAVAGRPARTLDGWMLGRATCEASYAAGSAGADVAIVEGMMGLFDGLSGASEAGSTAEVAKWLGLPVVLVVDAGAMARSVAAVVRGFRDFDPALRVAGVIFNRIGGPGHLAFLTEALASVDAPPCLGGLPEEATLGLPERHLGLVTAAERVLSCEALADAAERHLDVEALLALARTGARDAATRPGARAAGAAEPRVVIAVARDAAFSFYYPENLELLTRAGAELAAFSPLADAALPAGAGGVYLGGGYPELHAARLAANRRLLDALGRFAAAGGLVYAECGGLMLLGAGLRDATGRRHAMAGVLPLETCMLERGMTLGYREVEVVEGGVLPPLVARGHEFHHSTVEAVSGGAPGVARPYRVRDPVSGRTSADGFAVGRVLASYVHLHFASAPALAPALVAAARAGRIGLGGGGRTDGGGGPVETAAGRKGPGGARRDPGSGRADATAGRGAVRRGPRS